VHGTSAADGVAGRSTPGSVSISIDSISPLQFSSSTLSSVTAAVTGSPVGIACYNTDEQEI